MRDNSIWLNGTEQFNCQSLLGEAQVLLDGKSQSPIKRDTRQEIFAPIQEPELNPERRYVELDINNDGKDDLVISKSLSLGGTGGLPWDIYVRVEADSYRFIDTVGANVLSREMDYNVVRIWAYSHSSAGSGDIQYFYFDRNGEYHKSQRLGILPGDHGSETGNAIYKAIFNEKTRIETKVLPGSQEHGSPERR